MKLYEYLKIFFNEEDENVIVYDDESLKKRFESLKNEEINYIKPSYNVEEPEIKRITKKFKLTKSKVKTIENQFKENEIVDLNYTEIDNSDYSSIENFDQVLELAKKYGKNINRLLTQFENGEIEAPVILIKEGKNPELVDAEKENPYLIGGNTRLMLLKALGMKPKVLEIKI